MFDASKLYGTKDPEILAIAPRQTWDRWRYNRTGPSFIRIGRRVFYRGSELNDWLERQTTRTTGA